MDANKRRTKLGKFIRSLPGIILAANGLTEGQLLKLLWRLLENIHTALWISELLRRATEFIPQWLRWRPVAVNWTMFIVGLLWLSLVLWGDRLRVWWMQGEIAEPHASSHPEIVLSAEWPDERKPDIHMRFVDPLNHKLERPFIVSNHSEITAHNVKIRDIVRNGYTVTYPEIGFVRKGEDKPALPRVLDVDIFASKTLAPIFADDPIHNTEITIPIITDYEDVSGKQWETEQEMTYDRFWKTATFRFVRCGSKRSSSSLSKRIFALCTELSSYLSNRSERPDEDKLFAETHNDQATFQHRYKNEIQAWDDALSAGYWLKFKDRAINLRHELALQKMADSELDNALTALDKAATSQYRRSMNKLIERFRYQASLLDS
jgi:hypothetical protein